MTSQNQASLKKAASSVGAPAQHNQGSRKGKRAWRKNVDIEDVEQGLEVIRTEERVTGSAVHKKTNEELFHIDVKGDEKVRKSLPKFSTSLLTSTKILAQRSAVPAIFSRTNTNTPLKRKAVTHDDKGRLLRIAKRMRKGPFNAVIDPTELGAGSALLDVTEAVKKSGQYDVWVDQPDPDIEKTESGMVVQTVKPPPTPHVRAIIAVPAISEPHQGSSYNPPVTSHQELLRVAHEIEERRVKDVAATEYMKAKMAQAYRVAVSEETLGVAPGMTLDKAEQQAEDDEEPSAEAPPPRKIPARKTKQERRKAAKLRAEKRALADKLARKRLLASVDSAKSMRKAIDQTSTMRERAHVKRQEEMQEKLRKGLAGQRLGKHKVQEGRVDVQLGEDLSESLRALKPEGNLFRDRFVSMQHRALIEPRVPVLPTKRKAKLKEYEKHAWKRFDLEQ